ncbi:MAG: sigma-70 family RNA polymerase sigma factor [Eubacterium sp.]|nr:sigma-70 family RNA polymerase sigma factor [Eubacterium sp.]
MEDQRIIELFFARDEEALTAAEKKYGGYCLSIASRMLRTREDAEECVNDTWLGAWESIPPQRPEKLGAYLGKITRNLALKIVRRDTAAKRGGGEYELALDELQGAIPAGGSVDDQLLTGELTEAINRFLAALTQEERVLFVRRYFYFDSVKELAVAFGFTESKVKMQLKRTRDRLMQRLKEEGMMG